MTTQTTSKSIRARRLLHIAYACLRWTAVIVSLVLLLAALVLRAPWRLSLLFTIIPAVGIFMPRPLQKWCWIGLAIIIIGIYIWIRTPEEGSSQWQPYVYTKKITDFNTARGIPDTDNAAIKYTALFSRHNEDLFEFPMDSETDLATYLEPWDEDCFLKLSFWLETLRPDMAALIATSQMSDCRFSPPVDMAILQEQFKRINTMKTFVRDMLRSSNRNIFEGHVDIAMVKQLTALRIAQHLWQQQTLLDQAAGYYLSRMARRAMSRLVIDHITDINSLDTMKTAWVRADSRWPDNWDGILDCEKMQTISIAGAVYQQNKLGDVRFSRNLSQTLQHHFGSRLQKFALPAELARMVVLGFGLSIPSTPEGMAQLIEERFDRFSGMATSGINIETTTPAKWWYDGLNVGSAIDWHARRQTAYFYPLDTQNRQFEQDRTIMQILIALKKYKIQKGIWPETLEDAFDKMIVPIDSKNKKPFVYKKQNGSFILYSLGTNGIDDGGIKNSYARPRQDDVLFWPLKTLNGEEANGFTVGNGQ